MDWTYCSSVDWYFLIEQSLLYGKIQLKIYYYASNLAVKQAISNQLLHSMSEGLQCKDRKTHSKLFNAPTLEQFTLHNHH